MTTTTTQTIELGKAQFWTIEAFYFELEDGYYYGVGYLEEAEAAEGQEWESGEHGIQ